MGERQRAGEMTEVLPSQRYNAHMVPEDGSLTCTEAGVCKFALGGWSHLSHGLGKETGVVFMDIQPRSVPFIHTVTHSVHTLKCTFGALGARDRP